MRTIEQTHLFDDEKRVTKLKVSHGIKRLKRLRSAIDREIDDRLRRLTKMELLMSGCEDDQAKLFAEHEIHSISPYNRALITNPTKGLECSSSDRDEL